MFSTSFSVCPEADQRNQTETPCRVSCSALPAWDQWGRHALATRQSPGTLSCCPELTSQGATPPALVLGIRGLPLLSSISSLASRFHSPCALHCPWSSKEGVLCSSRARMRKWDYRASFSTDQLGTSPSHLSPLTQWLYLRTKEKANWPPLGRRRASTEAKATGFTGSPVTVPESEHRKGSHTHFPSPTLAEPALLRPTKWGEAPCPGDTTAALSPSSGALKLHSSPEGSLSPRTPS